jgi:hypothetical protein
MDTLKRKIERGAFEVMSWSGHKSDYLLYAEVPAVDVPLYDEYGTLVGWDRRANRLGDRIHIWLLDGINWAAWKLWCLVEETPFSTYPTYGADDK